MKEAKVSVIVPVYNVEKYLNKCVDSIINQTYKNLEIILVDDGSPDGCGKICDEYALKDNRIKVIHQENAGVSVARNRALDIATGSYVLFVDSDDWIELTLVDDCLECIKYNKVDIIMFNWNSVFVDKVIPGKTKYKNDQGFQNALDGILYDNIHCYLWNKLYKRELWDSIRLPVGVNFEDLAVMPLVFLNANSICYLEKALYNYDYTNTASITSVLSTKNKFGLFYSFRVRQELAKGLNKQDLFIYSRKRALRSAVTAYGLNTKEKVLSEEQVDCIKKYVLSEKKDKGLSGIGFKYQILAYGVIHCEAICKFYGSCMFFFEKMRRLLK